LPIIHSFPAQSGGAIPGFRANDMLLPASLSFAQLCRTLRGFLQKHDLPTRDAHLEWGVHRFCIESGIAFVDGAAVPLKPEEFDLALELFFNAGARVSRPWLRRRPTAPAADATVLRLRDMLGLQAKHGWDLQVNPGLSCKLVRADCMT
jgi:DNA-binding response OmpR family regulator